MCIHIHICTGPAACALADAADEAACAVACVTQFAASAALMAACAPARFSPCERPCAVCSILLRMRANFSESMGGSVSMCSRSACMHMHMCMQMCVCMHICITCTCACACTCGSVSMHSRSACEHAKPQRL